MTSEAALCLTADCLFCKMQLLETSFEVVLIFHNKHFGEISLAEHSKQFLRFSVARLVIHSQERWSLGISHLLPTGLGGCNMASHSPSGSPASLRLQFCVAYAPGFFLGVRPDPASVYFNLCVSESTRER